MKTKLNIDLGESDGPCPCPATDAAGPNKYYPTIYYRGKDYLDLPKEGIMTIKFRVKSETESETSEGEHSYSCDIEVQKILEVESDSPEAPYKSRNGAGDALDALMKAAMKMKDSDSDKEEY